MLVLSRTPASTQPQHLPRVHGYILKHPSTFFYITVCHPILLPSNESWKIHSQMTLSKKNFNFLHHKIKAIKSIAIFQFLCDHFLLSGNFFLLSFLRTFSLSISLTLHLCRQRSFHSSAKDLLQAFSNDLSDIDFPFKFFLSIDCSRKLLRLRSCRMYREEVTFTCSRSEV